MDAYGDAGYKSLPDKVSSCGGRAIFVTNRRTNMACLVSWRSKKLKRIVASSTTAEALATNDAIGEALYVQAVLKEMQGDWGVNILIKVYTDSKNLHKAANTSALVEDSKLRLDLAILKESILSNEFKRVYSCRGQENVGRLLD